jgi:hypothetical protein
LSYSKTHLSDFHHHFIKNWQEQETEQRALPPVEADRDLKQQLQELVAKKLKEESKNDVARLMIRLQASLKHM